MLEHFIKVSTFEANVSSYFDCLLYGGNNSLKVFFVSYFFIYLFFVFCSKLMRFVESIVLIVTLYARLYQSLIPPRTHPLILNANFEM